MDAKLKSTGVEKLKGSNLFNLSTLQPFNRLCRCLAICLVVCQCLANAGCATESRMDGLVAGMAARHAALLEAAQ